jgi:hypothetical protein
MRTLNTGNGTAELAKGGRRPESPEDVVRAALRRVKKGKKKSPSEVEKRLLER